MWGLWEPVSSRLVDQAVLVYVRGFHIAHWNARARQWVGQDWDSPETLAMQANPPDLWMELPPAPAAGREDWPWKLIGPAPMDHIMLVYNHAYHVARFSTDEDRWIGIGKNSPDTIALAQFPPTHWAELVLQREEFMSHPAQNPAQGERTHPKNLD